MCKLFWLSRTLACVVCVWLWVSGWELLCGLGVAVGVLVVWAVRGWGLFDCSILFVGASWRVCPCPETPRRHMTFRPKFLCLGTGLGFLPWNSVTSQEDPLRQEFETVKSKEEVWANAFRRRAARQAGGLISQAGSSQHRTFRRCHTCLCQLSVARCDPGGPLLHGCTHFAGASMFTAGVQCNP